MGTVHAVFEDGVFRPLEQIALPNGSKVEFEPRVVQAPKSGQRERIAAILSKSYDTDEPELAAKHDEHQP